MRRSLRLVIALIQGLKPLTWAASALVRRTTRGWHFSAAGGAPR